jgi:hypothetical protein
MELFFKLEGGYIIIAIFTLAITIFVTTRDFMPKNSFKKGIIYVSLTLAILIGLHFKITTDRIDKVEKAFKDGNTIICESRMFRNASQSVEIQKDREWILDNYIFKSPNFNRGFFIARCVVK